MAYIKALETDQLSLPSAPEFWVRIKKTATYGDQLEAQSAMLKLEPNSSGVISQMEWAGYIRALTTSMLVEWNLTDESEAILPITIANLNRLSPEDGQFLATEVTNRAKTRGVEQERPFALQSSKP